MMVGIFGVWAELDLVAKTPPVPSIVDAFERCAARRPDAVAVQFGDTQMRYAALDHRANALAWRLIDSGIRPGDTVAICVAPGPAIPLGVLAILKAGAIYMPLSHRDPPARIGAMIADAGGCCVVTDTALVERLSGLAPLVVPIDAATEETTRSPEVRRRGDDIAYILHTSGSTGHPKAVMVPHAALAHYLRWHIAALRTDASALDLPLSSSICFAAGVTQLFTPLLLGVTLHILPPDMVRQPEQLFAWYADHPDFGLYCVPTLWSDLVRFAETERIADRAVTPPRAVLLSGEALRETLAARSFALWPALRLWNLYGPTEGTANACGGEIFSGGPVTLGRPIAGTTLRIVDDDLTDVAPGMIGEILIDGPSVAAGYRGLPDETAARFLPSPRGPGARMFRTGDFAELGTDGALRFVGRRDLMVKLHGHRIECGEVEAALLADPAIRQAAVVYHDAPEPALAGYVVATDDTAPDVLRARLALRLPDYMIPATITILQTFPTLANGKTDRRALPHPDRQRPPLSYPYAPPLDPIETMLIAIWERVLGITGVGACDDVFDLGGTSLKVAAALVDMRETLGLALSFGDVFAHRTPRDMIRHAVPVDASAPPARRTPLAPLADDATRPCHDNQQSLWLLDQTYPGQTAYTMQFAVRLDGVLDPALLGAALSDVLRRHPVLRSVVVAHRGVPALTVCPARAITLDAIPHENDAEMTRRMAVARALPFDLARDPLIRFALHASGATRHHLVVTVHHLIFDGRSIPVFFDDLVRTYAAMAGGSHLPAPPAPGQAEWAVSRTAQPYAEASRAFWTEMLADCPRVLDLATDSPRPAERRMAGAVVAARIDRTLLQRLVRLGQDQGATLFMTLFAAFALLLFRHTGQRDFAVGVPVANRDRRETEAMLGYFANTLALRAQLADKDDFRALLVGVRDTVVAALEHQALPFEQVVRALGIERQSSYAPVFQTMFALHETVPERRVVAGLAAEVREITNDAAKFDLTLEGHVDADGIDLRLVHSDLFAAARMEQMLAQYCHLLEEIAADPARALDAFPLVPEADARATTARRNATAAVRPHDIGLHRLVEHQAAATPDRLALIAGAERLTYRALDARANQLARYLARHGVITGTAVGIALEPGTDMIVAILAILKLGGAYVPLDPAYPAERLRYIIADSGVAAVIANAADPSNTDVRTFVYDALRAEIAGLPDDAGVSVPVAGETLAYIMYTSGSSGRPKGVMVQHGGASNYVLWMARAFPLDAHDRVLCKTSINFDISVWEIFLPLVTGATLVVAGNGDIQAPDALAALIAREAVTQVQFVPSALRSFVDSGALARCTRLKRLFAGGEALSRQLQDAVFADFAGELHNLYGPTEASIYACHWACRRDETRRDVPIGGPIDNIQIHILDATLRPVAPGITGELHIGGDGVALGYRNLPEQTTRAFVADPFSARTGARLFRTGDRAREVASGAIEFLGRGDGQVKVRGHRIELGDIEQNLASHPGVRQVKVMIREDQADDVRIVAYIIAAPGQSPSTQDLREHLRRKLPGFMIPQRFLLLPHLPLLPNGKIDLSALPRPKPQPDAAPARNGGAQLAALSAIWEELLETRQFGPNDNFFDMGGHSLLLARLAALINERLGASVTIVELFRFPTIAAMDRHLSDRGAATGDIARQMARRVALQRGHSQ